MKRLKIAREFVWRVTGKLFFTYFALNLEINIPKTADKKRAAASAKATIAFYSCTVATLYDKQDTVFDLSFLIDR